MSLEYCVKIESLKKRSDFLALRRAPSISKRGFKLVRGDGRLRVKSHGGRSGLPRQEVSLMEQDPSSEENSVRVGYTVTKKLGNAVRRNRIKRRLKSAIISVLPLQDDKNSDYVVIAHRGAYDMPFAELIKEMAQALTELQLAAIKHDRTPEEKARGAKAKGTKS